MTEENFETKKSFPDKVKTYIKQNKFLSISIMLLLVLIIILMTVYVVMGKSNYSTDTSQVSSTTPGAISTTASESTPVDILPVTQREDEDYKGRDPFSSPAVLKGTVLNDKGGDLAIIEIGGSTYICSKGERISDIWTVKSIKDKEVVISKSGNDTVLRLEENVAPVQQSSTAKN